MQQLITAINKPSILAALSILAMGFFIGGIILAVLTFTPLGQNLWLDVGHTIQ